jgi:hypothetical protein
MLTPMRITKNGKGGFRFTMPREIRKLIDWIPEDKFIAYPIDTKTLAIKHFRYTDPDYFVTPPEEYKDMVYSLYVLKDKPQLIIEIPNKLNQFYNWQEQRLLVAAYDGLDFITLRSIIKL